MQTRAQAAIASWRLGHALGAYRSLSNALRRPCKQTRFFPASRQRCLAPGPAQTPPTCSTGRLARSATQLEPSAAGLAGGREPARGRRPGARGRPPLAMTAHAGVKWKILLALGIVLLPAAAAQGGGSGGGFNAQPPAQLWGPLSPGQATVRTGAELLQALEQNVGEIILQGERQARSVCLMYVPQVLSGPARPAAAAMPCPPILLPESICVPCRGCQAD